MLPRTPFTGTVVDDFTITCVYSENQNALLTQILILSYLFSSSCTPVLFSCTPFGIYTDIVTYIGYFNVVTPSLGYLII